MHAAARDHVFHAYILPPLEQGRVGREDSVISKSPNAILRAPDSPPLEEVVAKPNAGPQPQPVRSESQGQG